MNDWSVHLSNSNNVTERSISESQNEGPNSSDNHISVEPIGGSPNGLMNSSWPMCLHDTHHTAQSQYSTANNTGVEQWRFRTIANGAIESGAVIDKTGTIYFGSMGSDRRFTALYPNGTLRWEYKTGNLIWSDPAIAEDSTVYVCSWDCYLYAFYQNGSVKWMFHGGGSLSSSPAIGQDGTIYFGGAHGYIYAVNSNGTEKWRYYVGGDLTSAPAIGEDGTIYIGTTSNSLCAINSNGTLRWRFGTDGWVKGNPSIATDGTIYVPSFDGSFYALYPNGTMKWKASTGSSVAARSVAITSDGTLYVGTEALRAFNPDGTLKWICDVGGDIYGSSPAISSDGTIYVSAGVNLVAVTPDGLVKWKTPIAHIFARSSPCIGEDGTVYVGSTCGAGAWWYGYFYAIGAGEPRNIEIQSPEPGNLYLFGKDLGPTPKNNTVILGSVKVKANAYPEHEIDSVHFYLDGKDCYNVTAPPYEWNMNQRYGPLFPLRHTLTVTAYYSGGWWRSASREVSYLHLLKF